MYRYHKYTLKLQGFDPNGNRTIVTPLHNNEPITIYSRDNQFFSSADFSVNEPLTTGLNNQNQINRVEFHIYHDGVVKINDNIDFALIRKSVLHNEHTVIDDNSIIGDASNVQKIYYLYIAENNASEFICSFNIIMTNKMQRGTELGNKTDIPARFNNLIMTYSVGSARRTFSDNEGNLISTTATSGNEGKKRIYNNQKKKVFMVHFVTEATANDTSKNTIFNNTNNNLEMNMSYSNTRRRFTSPFFAAIVLGSLIRTQLTITNTGLTFGDGSCYPSANHVNGQGMDTGYLSLQQTADDVTFMTALAFYGMRYFAIGPSKTALETAIVTALANNGFGIGV